MKAILGLDIGGANTKGCYLEISDGKVLKVQGCSICHEVWKNIEGVKDVLNKFKDLYYLELENITKNNIIALTMTAELCDVFKSKAQGVISILLMVEEVFKGFSLYIWSSRGIFVTPAEVKKDPLQVAAANWLASAEALAQSVFLENKAAIFADMGSTTTDIIPLSKGKVLVQGRTDTERLVSGELVYTGLLRTSISSIVDYIYLDGVRCRVANEYFAISADVYRLLGLISEKDYDVPTPDGGKRDIEGCARRLARVIASDLEELGIEKIFVMARYLQDKQIQQIADSIWQIISRKKIAFPQYLISTGQGSFLLEEVAHRLLCPIIPWWEIIPGAQVEQVMSAYSVAWLLSERLSK